MKNNKTSQTNTAYLDVYTGLILTLLSREDIKNPAVKNILRFLVREASNCTSDLPCYDNKLGSKMTSVKAIERISKIKDGNYTGLVGDHVVPVSVINEKLIELKSIDVDAIKRTISKFAVRAVITKEEDAILRESKYIKKMPDEWNENIFARYEKAGIELKNIPYKIVLKEAKNRVKFDLHQKSINAN